MEFLFIIELGLIVFALFGIGRLLGDIRNELYDISVGLKKIWEK